MRTGQILCYFIGQKETSMVGKEVEKELEIENEEDTKIQIEDIEKEDSEDTDNSENGEEFLENDEEEKD